MSTSKDPVPSVPPPPYSAAYSLPYPEQNYGGVGPYSAYPGEVPPQNPQTNYNSNAGYLFSSSEADVERGHEPVSEFFDKKVRHNFIRKVYGILLTQLIITGLGVFCFLAYDPLRLYVRNHVMAFFYGSFAVSIVVLLVIVCCGELRRKTPWNYILLFAFTLCETVMLGIITSRYSTEAVLIALGITAAVTLALTLFAFQTKFDFTACGGILLALLVILFFAGLLMIFLPQNRYASIAYGAAGALIFSIYIVYDTQLMLGGKHKYSLSPEEYIFAALNLYMDVVNLFIFILGLVGLMDR